MFLRIEIVLPVECKRSRRSKQQKGQEKVEGTVCLVYSHKQNNISLQNGTKAENDYEVNCSLLFATYRISMGYNYSSFRTRSLPINNIFTLLHHKFKL